MKDTIKNGLLLLLKEARHSFRRATDEANNAARELSEQRARQADAQARCEDLVDHLRAHGVSDEEIGAIT